MEEKTFDSLVIYEALCNLGFDPDGFIEPMTTEQRAALQDLTGWLGSISGRVRFERVWP